MANNQKMRTESDLLGSVELPADVLYGVQTLRGIENFRISKFHLNEYPLFIKGLAITKLGLRKPITNWGCSPTRSSMRSHRPAARSWTASTTTHSPWI